MDNAGRPERAPVRAAERAPLRRSFRERPRVALKPHGLDLGTEGVLPLRAGAMHYWRHAPQEWGAGLDAIRSMGLLLVDVYVPWGVHEIGPGTYDFGEHDPRLGVAGFLALAHARGLKVVLRPGPHINAELTYFGLPERIVWDRACQARTPRDNPVMLPMVPLAFPVPSYASDAFHDEVQQWFEAVAKLLGPLRHPDGPIVLVQIDNEGALYFRDGPYDQDYHPDAILLFRAFLRSKYRSSKDLAEAWQKEQLSFARALPPSLFDATDADELARHIDWMEFHEHLLTRGLERMARALTTAGFDGIPTMHNFPLGESATPLNPARIEGVIDLVGLDYYHRASPTEHMTIFRRTSELVCRCEGGGVPAYGAEVGVGFPPFFAPLDTDDSLYTLLCALAYGLRGFNLYMAVERDRWVGAPVDPHGRRRPLADAYEALNRALEATRFHELKRRAPVRLVVPRSLRRLARATHAFGPLTPALFNVMGAGLRESCLEDDLGLGGVVPMIGEAYLRAFERALTARGVPFAYAGGESLDESLVGAEWIVCATAGGVKRSIFTQLRAARKRGALVTVGPHVPDRDGSMRRMRTPHDARGLEIEPLEDAARADALVARRVEELVLPTYPVDPPEAYVSVHEDEARTPKVVFVMNPTPRDLVVKVALPPALALLDILPPAAPKGAERDRRIARIAGAFEVSVSARSARMFSIES
jgi:beta-galactosidase